MTTRNCILCKLVALTVIGILCLILLLVSAGMDYQWFMAEEHIRFRSGLPLQSNWLSSPVGTFRVYLFNVTNSQRFLNGSDLRLKVEEVGPIVYKIKGRNEIIKQSEGMLTFRKVRFEDVSFDAAASCSPDILNQTIILPNLVLLSSAAKLHDWVFLVRHAFNAITINEAVFLNETVHYFLWDFTLPALSLLSKYVPNLVTNCGLLHNALQNRNEIYNVKIGAKNGMKDFFRINHLNNRTYFTEHKTYLRYAKEIRSNGNRGAYCPIIVEGTFDNSLFPLYLRPNDELNIAAFELCRTFRLNYDSTIKSYGFDAYRYTLSDTNRNLTCLNTAMGIQLHKGMFDTSQCMFNDVPSAVSAPHFMDTTYNYNEHYQNIHPERRKHETYVVIEPITGIPLEEKYRFQGNIPMPDMKGFNKNLQRFSNVIIPSFWYEYDLDEYPWTSLLLMKLQVKLIPILQPIVMALFAFITFLCFLRIYLVLSKQTFCDIFQRCY